MTDEKKKKKKKKKSKTPSEPPFDDEFEGDIEERYDEELDYQEKGEEFNDMKNSLNKYFSKNMPNMDFNKIFSQIFRQFNIDPSKMPDQAELNRMFRDLLGKMKFDPTKLPNSEELKKMMKNNQGKATIRGPFVFGVNMKLGKDGKLKFDSFGNVKQKQHGETEVKEVRSPMIDIIDNEEEDLIVVAEVPGVLKKNIELKANERSITIIANEVNEENGKLTPKYETTVELPCSINPDHAQASLKNGILEIKLKKKAKTGRKISVE